MLNIYQIVILENEIDPRNAWASPKFVAQQNVSVFGNESLQDEYLQFFGKVAETTFATKEEAFEGMNMWTAESESKITRIRPLHSLSVGDIVHDTATGKAYMCERMGWAELADCQTSNIGEVAA